MVERRVIEGPGELIDRSGDVVTLMGLRSRKEFTLVALWQPQIQHHPQTHHNTAKHLKEP